MAVRRNGETDTASAILDVAERLVQTRGFNAFSYADVATELGITKPALHYHFPGKAELGQALLARYTTRFIDALEAIDAGTSSAASKLERYVDLYGRVLAQERMCLCGMLASDYDTLPKPMRQAVTSLLRPQRDLGLERVGRGPVRRNPTSRRRVPGGGRDDHRGSRGRDAGGANAPRPPPLRRHHQAAPRRRRRAARGAAARPIGSRKGCWCTNSPLPGARVGHRCTDGPLEDDGDQASAETPRPIGQLTPVAWFGQ